MDEKNRSKSPLLSAEALVTQLNTSLPVSVKTADVEKHPEMSKLLEDLIHRLTPTGMSKETHSKFIMAKHSAEYARQKYLEEATFFRLIEDALDGRLNGAEQESHKDVSRALTLSELQDHLQLLKCRSNKNVSDDLNKNSDDALKEQKHYVFDISPDLVIEKSKNYLSDKSIKKTTSTIEEHLENEWTKIAAFYDPVGFMSYDPDEVSKIPELLEQKSSAVTSERKKLEQRVMQNDYLFLKTQEQLVEFGTLLKSLMGKQRLCQYPHVHTKYQVEQLSAIVLKLECNGLEMLANTYTNESIPALKLISSHIKERMAKAEKNLVRLKHELCSFDRLDPRFKELLTDYAKIKADIEMFKASTGKP